MSGTRDKQLRNAAAVRLALAGALSIGALGLTGCGGKKPVRQHTIARQEGTLKESVISGTPARDSIANDLADEKLTEADWRLLEKLGPRPVWEQLQANKKNCRRRGAPRRSSVIPDATASAARPDSASTGPSTTQPATQPSDSGATRAMGAVPEEELPVEIVELPDGKLRMIWRLRSYGGSSVDYTKNGSTSRRDLKVAPPDLTPLVSVITPALGAGGTVIPLPKENTLVIVCGKEMRSSVVDLLATLDVPPRQVEITAKIFEVSRDFDFQQGTELMLKHLAEDSSQNLISNFSAKRFADAVGGAQPQGSVLKLMQVFADAGVSVEASFQLLAESGMINVVSSPRMTVAVGQTGYMLAGQELPIQSAIVANNVLTTSTSYKPVGVQLYVTPQAVGPNRVKLHTISIVSAVSGFSPMPTLDGHNNPRNLINPIIDSREAETAVTVEDGSTLVISGLRMVRTTTREAKVPGLGDIPLLGWMFKNHRTQQQQTDLYFFLTPTLL
ncbi:MAG TPA: hypothetical protein VFB66_19625 [Tepidisphaeraceae bacterium]|nr:hypothetical protein [Tepidisphaeraceae bacterium]